MAHTDRFRYSCILIGGFLGPFAGQSLAVVLPEFAGDFGISLRLASLSMTAYVLPFAVMMLFSTHLVRNHSPSKVVRIAYTVIALSAVVLVFSTRWWTFVLAYAVAGVANAFTTPLLQLILQHITPQAELGKALGTYAAMQSFGLFSAPLVAGIAVSVWSWHLSFVALLVFSVVIAVAGLPTTPARGTGTRARMLTWPVIRGCLTLFAVGVSVLGMGFMISIHAENAFGASPVQRGLIVMAGGLTAFVLSRPVGALADSFGPRRVITAGLVVAAVAMVGAVMSTQIIVLAVLWGVAVLGAQAVQVSVNLLILRSPTGGQLLSTVQAFRFFGNALTPLVILPVYGMNQLAGFALAAVFLLAMVPASLRAGR